MHKGWAGLFIYKFLTSQPKEIKEKDYPLESRNEM